MAARCDSVLVAAMSGTALAQSPSDSAAPASMAPAASIPVPAAPFTIAIRMWASATASARSRSARPRPSNCAVGIVNPLTNLIHRNTMRSQLSICDADLADVNAIVFNPTTRTR